MSQPTAARLTGSLQARALDLRDRITGRHDALVPPRRLNFVGDTDFVATGEEFVEHFERLAGLRDDDRVLDIGCGIGRLARPLTRRISGGSYDGFDINRTGIEWCRSHYGPFGNFNFAVADLYNATYNPSGRQPAGEFRFPYADGAFTFAFATSVFTHMLEDDVDHYLAECARVLEPGGRLLSTWFLLDDISRAAVASGASAIAFLTPSECTSVMSDALPEEAVAFDSEWVHKRMRAHGMKARQPVYHGVWSARANGLSYQDIVVADRI